MDQTLQAPVGTMPTYTDHFVKVNNINLHYIEYASDGPVLLMLHGLTANAHAFDGLVADGLNNNFRIISPDQRGRGLTDHPAFSYSIESHARDIIGLMDSLNLKKVTLAGHSFGGLISFYMAASYPDRIEKVIILDAAAEMNSHALDMLSFAIGRFNFTYPSMAAYIQEMKNAPYNDFWEDTMLNYYHADVKENADGTVRSRNNITDITEISVSVFNISWPYYVRRVNQPAILLNAVDDYTLGQRMLPEDKARDSVNMMKQAKYIPIAGNHQTMLYGKGAKQIVAAINEFAGK